MAKSGSFFGADNYTKEDREFAKQYDEQQSVFRPAQSSSDPTIKNAVKASRENYDKLRKIKQDFQSLNPECKDEFRRWLQTQNLSLSPTKK